MLDAITVLVVVSVSVYVARHAFVTLALQFGTPGFPLVFQARVGAVGGGGTTGLPLQPANSTIVRIDRLLRNAAEPCWRAKDTVRYSSRRRCRSDRLPGRILASNDQRERMIVAEWDSAGRRVSEGRQRGRDRRANDSAGSRISQRERSQATCRYLRCAGRDAGVR